MSFTKSRSQAPIVEMHGKYVGCCCPGAIATAAKQLGWAGKTPNVPSQQIVHLFWCCPEFRILAGGTMEKLLNRMNLEEYGKPWKTQRYHIVIGKSRWAESWGGNRLGRQILWTTASFWKFAEDWEDKKDWKIAEMVLILGDMWNSRAQSWIRKCVSEWGNFSQIMNVLFGFFT